MRRTVCAARVRVEELEGRIVPNGFPIVPTVTPPHDWNIYREITDAAGDVIVVGSAQDDTRILGWTTDFAVARYTPDGRLDARFGNGGMVTTALNPFDDGDIAYDVVVQPDGKLVVVGGAASNQYFDESGASHIVSGGFAVVRYNADGSIDTTFGTGGEVVTPFFGYPTGDWSWGQAVAVALQPDGSIVAAGTAFGGTLPNPPPSSFLPGENDITVVRYTSDGQLDGSFGNGGVVQVSFGGLDVANAVTVNPDGTILVTGTDELYLDDPAMGGNWPGGAGTQTYDSTVPVWVLLNPDGSLAGISDGGGIVNPGDPPPPSLGDSGDGGGGGGIAPFVLGPTGFAPGLDGAIEPSILSVAGPSAAAGTPAANGSTGAGTTPTAASQPTVAAGVPFISQAPPPLSIPAQTPVSSGASVTITTPTGGTAAPTANVSNPTPLGTSHTKTGDATSDDGTNGNPLAPPAPVSNSEDDIAILRDDYFARLSPLSPKVTPLDGPTAGDAFLPAAVLVLGSVAFLPIDSRARRRRRTIRVDPA